MKINNHLVNPTVKFNALAVGDVFMTLAGDVYLKVATSRERWPEPHAPKNVFCLNADSLQSIDEGTETVPVEVELTLKKNVYEKYNKSIR